METKTCFKCGRTLPLTEFYANKGMADGHLNKCKECTKRDVKRHRDESPEAENAKLRELVRDMHKWLWNGADCAECPFVAKCDLNAAFESDIHAHVCLGWSEIHRRMRELGVGVDA